MEDQATRTQRPTLARIALRILQSGWATFRTPGLYVHCLASVVIVVDVMAL